MVLELGVERLEVVGHDEVQPLDHRASVVLGELGLALVAPFRLHEGDACPVGSRFDRDGVQSLTVDDSKGRGFVGELVLGCHRERRQAAAEESVGALFLGKPLEIAEID
jgi:hypothetical protein